MSKLIQKRSIPRRPVTNRLQEILLATRGKKVLHFGCADYPFTLQRGDQLLHLQLSKHARELWGIDASEEGIDELKKMGCDNVFVANAENLDQTLKDEKFDVIVAGEIIEHLSNPGQFLDSIAAIMNENTELVLTTINAFTLKIFLYAFFYREKVHPDHNYYFSYYTLKQLVEKCHLQCVDTYYYQEVNGAGISLLVDKGFRLIAQFFPALSDGLILKAKVAMPGQGRSQEVN